MQHCDSTCSWCARDFFAWWKRRVKSQDAETGRSGAGSFNLAAATSVRPPRTPSRIGDPMPDDFLHTLPPHLRDDAPPQTCDKCGRRTYAHLLESGPNQCGMPQPDGSVCDGRFPGRPPIDKREQARQLYILADMVACGCAELVMVTETSAIAPHAIGVGIEGTVRGCVKRDHAKDWPVRP